MRGAKRGYLHTFKIPFILLALLLVITAVVRTLLGEEGEAYVRTNEVCPEERVFDYADKLSDDEEEALREKIADGEAGTGCDIVIVILEESLEEYALSYEEVIGPVEPYQYTMVFADNFYDEHQFGFNKPVGDGIILVDNWYREWDGGLYNWISTSGRVYDHYSESMIEDLTNAFIEEVEVDAASAYGLFVDMVAEEMGAGRTGGGDSFIPVWLILIAAAAVSLIFFFVNYGGRKGNKTVEAATYVKTGKPDIREKEDQFLTKTITKRKIPTSSGGSGSSGGRGGGHISAGGHRHGGGGGRR